MLPAGGICRDFIQRHFYFPEIIRIFEQLQINNTKKSKQKKVKVHYINDIKSEVTMKKLFIFPMIIGIIFVCGCKTEPKTIINKEKEKQAIKLVLEKYALANENQDMNLIEDIWCPSDQIVSFGTEGDEKHIGFGDIKSAVQKQFNVFSNTFISYRDQIIGLNEDGNTAWFSEIINYNFIYEGKAHQFEGIRYTGVLVKKDGKWKLVQTHMSIPAEPIK